MGTCGVGDKGQTALVEESESRVTRAHLVPEHHFPRTSGKHQSHTEVCVKPLVVVCALILRMGTQGHLLEHTDTLSQGSYPQSFVNIPGPSCTLRWTPGHAVEMSTERSLLGGIQWPLGNLAPADTKGSLRPGSYCLSAFWRLPQIVCLLWAM